MAAGKGPHPLWLSLQVQGHQLLQQRPPRRQLSMVSTPSGGQPGPRCPQPPHPHGPWTAQSYKAEWTWPSSACGSLYLPPPRTCNVPASLPLPTLATPSGRPLFSTDWPSWGRVGVSHGAPGFFHPILTVAPPLLYPPPGGPAERPDFALDLDRGFPTHRSKPSELWAGSDSPPQLSDGWDPCRSNASPPGILPSGPATPTAPRAVPLEAL